MRSTPMTPSCWTGISRRASECRRELDELRETTALLAFASKPIEPPASLRASILDAVARQIACARRTAPRTRLAFLRGAFAGALVAAAVALVIGIVAAWPVERHTQRPGAAPRGSRARSGRPQRLKREARALRPAGAEAWPHLRGVADRERQDARAGRALQGRQGGRRRPRRQRRRRRSRSRSRSSPPAARSSRRPNRSPARPSRSATDATRRARRRTGGCGSARRSRARTRSRSGSGSRTPRSGR